MTPSSVIQPFPYFFLSFNQLYCGEYVTIKIETSSPQLYYIIICQYWLLFLKIRLVYVHSLLLRTVNDITTSFIDLVI